MSELPLVRSRRLARLRASFPAHRVEALLVTTPANISYLSGFTGSAGALLIFRRRALLVSDFRYLLQARQQAPGFRFVQAEKSLLEELAEVVRDSRIRRLGFEAENLSYHSFRQFATRLKGVKLVGLKQTVEQIRLVKDQGEQRKIQAAARITDQALRYALSLLKPGVSESKVALEVEHFIKSKSESGMAFDLIVASGRRSALPHAQPTSRKLRRGDLVVLDLGAKYQGYCSDLTRTVAIGKASRRQKEIYSVVHSAQAEALAEVRPGMAASKLDALARDHIKQAGFGRYFGHGLGHGVGLEVHEGPTLARKAKGVLEPGMVITIEPGIYIPNLGGVRIEDLVLVTKSGAKVLSRGPKPQELPII